MKTLRSYSVWMILGLLILAACSNPAPAPTQPATNSSSASLQPSAPAMPAAGPTTSSPADPKLQSSAGTTAPAPAPQTEKATPKDVVILKASLGGVRFQHKLHAEARKIACETCHHASHPEKPATAPQQACSACHPFSALPPMKTKLQAAFHNPTASAGTCIDCHKAQNAKGQHAPVKCLECHKKENT